jgi:hypothetical protein
MKSFALLLLTTTPALAQTTFRIGPQVGANTFTTRYEGNPNAFGSTFRTPTYKPGVETGIKAVISRKHFAVQPALLYTQKRFGLTAAYTEPVAGGTLDRTIEDDFNLNYLCLPLNFAYSLGKNGQGLQLFAGPYLGFLLGGKVKFDDVTVANSGYTTYYRTTLAIKAKSEVTDVDNQYFQRWDAGVQAGIGYAYQRFLLQGTYAWALTDSGVRYPTNPTPLQKGPEYRPRGWTLSLGYLVAKSGG